MNQCPVCGQSLDPNAKTPFCPQCGTALTQLMQSVRLLTGTRWLDVLIGMLMGLGLAMMLIGLASVLMSFFALGWAVGAVLGLMLNLGIYFLMRRFYPLVGRGVAISGITLLLLFLGLLWLCSGFKG